MQLRLIDDLPFVSVVVVHDGNVVEIPNVLLDTGSASTIFSADTMVQIGIVPTPNDVLHTIRGVGGTEVVFLRQLEQIQIGKKSLRDFEIEIGGMDYGFDINGIVGMNFLLTSGAIIDLFDLQMSFAEG